MRLYLPQRPTLFPQTLPSMKKQPPINGLIYSPVSLILSSSILNFLCISENTIFQDSSAVMTWFGVVAFYTIFCIKKLDQEQASTNSNSHLLRSTKRDQKSSTLNAFSQRIDIPMTPIWYDSSESEQEMKLADCKVTKPPS